MPLYVRKQLAHVALMPILLYGLEIYSGATDSNINRLKKYFNRIIRYVYKLKPRDHVSAHVIDFLGCPFEDFLKLKIMMLFYKVFQNASPNYLISRFDFGRSSRSHTLLCPHYNSLIMQRSFVVRVFRIWNYVLPYTDRHFACSIREFKNKIINIF